MARTTARRSSVAVGLGVAATAAAVGWTAPASAATPTVSVRCISSNSSETSVTGELAGFEANQPYRSLSVWRVGPDGSSSTYAFDVESPTDADGNHDIGVNIGFPNSLPVRVAWAVYLDANGDRHYQEAEAVYRGNGDLTACPQTINLSPK